MYDRNSVKRSDLGGGKVMTSFRVFPPFLELLEKTAIGRACLGRDIVTDYDRLEKLIVAVEAATAEELDLARPVLLYHIAELKDFIRDTAFNVEFKLKIGNSAAAVADSILEGVCSEIRDGIKKLSTSPKNKGNQAFIRGSMSYLAELLAVASAASVASPEFEDVKQKASDRYVLYSRDIRKAAEGLEHAYAGITERLGQSDQILLDADGHVRAVDLSVPKLSAVAIDRLSWMIGDRDRLWAVQSEAQMAAAIEKGHYTKLTDRDVGEIKQDLTALFSEINRAFNTGGFVAEILMTASALAYRATDVLHQAEKHTVQQMKNIRQSIYDSKAEHQRLVERRIDEVPADRFRMRSDSSETMRKSTLVADFITAVNSELHPETSSVCRMTFRRLKDEMLIGTVPGWNECFVVFRDRSVAIPDAAYVARVPKADVSEDLSPLAAKEYFGTSFFSTDDALHHLISDFAADFFYEGRRISGHDGFELLAAERKQIQQELRDGADIRSFAEYDGTTSSSMAP